MESSTGQPTSTPMNSRTTSSEPISADDILRRLRARLPGERLQRTIDAPIERARDRFQDTQKPPDDPRDLPRVLGDFLRAAYAELGRQARGPSSKDEAMTLSWLNRWRGILTRTAKKAANYLAIIQLACVLLWYRRSWRLANMR